mgnify:CR=1 FL=1
MYSYYLCIIILVIYSKTTIHLLIKVLSKHLQPYEVKALTEGKAEDEAPKKTKQDKDIKDREGTQPAKYYAKDAEGDKM